MPGRAELASGQCGKADFSIPLRDLLSSGCAVLLLCFAGGRWETLLLQTLFDEDVVGVLAMVVLAQQKFFSIFPSQTLGSWLEASTRLRSSAHMANPTPVTH